MITLHCHLGLLAFFWDFYQILVSGQRFLLHLVFFLQVCNLCVIFLNLVANTFRWFDCVLVLKIKCPCETFQVVLGVYQIFNAHLRELEQLDEVVVSEPFHVFFINVSVGDVLKEAFELSQVDLLCDLVNVSVHYLAPVKSSSSFLELKLWWHWGIQTVIKTCAKQVFSWVLDTRELQAVVDICSAYHSFRFVHLEFKNV
jgi:hypothetical protein